VKHRQREPIVLAQMRPFTLFLVLCGCIAVTFAFLHISSVMRWVQRLLSALGPVIAGVIFAYLLNPAAMVVERRLRRIFAKPLGKHPKLSHVPRVISAFTVVLLFIGSIALLCIAVFSQVVDGITTFLDKLPGYIETVMQKGEELLHSGSTLSRYLEELSERFSASEFGMGQVDTADMTQRILSALASGAAGTLGFLYNVVIGFIIAVYLLVSKERFLRQWKQILYAAVSPKIARRIDEETVNANQLFGTAVLGKLVDSLLIGAICFLSNAVMGMPYATLIAVIIGVTNMIPYFGPVIGAIPCVLLILMENPVKALYFLIFIVVLQQLDANFIDPRIVGKSIGLPAFWELFACLVGGGLFGLIGLVIGVPVFALIYQLIRREVTEHLRDRVRRQELTAEFLTEKLQIEMPEEEAADPLPESPYMQRFIQLDELSGESEQ